MGYGLKVELSLNEVELIWEAFQKFFKESYFERIERNRNNEELGRYEFIARTPKGDEIECRIYLANEWNIPQISISVFVSSRYKNCDFSKYWKRWVEKVRYEALRPGQYAKKP